MADNFLQGMGLGLQASQQSLQSAQSDREFLFRQHVYDAQAPMRDAQLSLIGSQIQSSNAEAVTKSLIAKNAVLQQEGAAEAWDIANIIAQDGFTEKNRSILYSYVAKAPWMGNSPWMKTMEDNFDVAGKAEAKAQAVKEQEAFKIHLAIKAAEDKAAMQKSHDERVAAMNVEMQGLRNAGKQTGATKEVSIRSLTTQFLASDPTLSPQEARLKAMKAIEAENPQPASPKDTQAMGEEFYNRFVTKRPGEEIPEHLLPFAPKVKKTYQRDPKTGKVF